MADSITRLFQAAQACRHDDPSTSRTARLLRSGRAKMAKKLAEEAVEVVIDAMHGDRDAVVKESADLLYNLVVLWVASGIRPEDVWKEMDRRERLLGIAEKVPKKLPEDFPRRKIVMLECSRAGKRRGSVSRHLAAILRGSRSLPSSRPLRAGPVGSHLRVTDSKQPLELNP